MRSAFDRARYSSTIITRDSKSNTSPSRFHKLRRLEPRNSRRVHKAIGHLADGSLEQHRPSSGLKENCKRFNACSQIQVPRKVRLRTSDRNHVRYQVVPMMNAGHDAELKVQNLFQLRRNGYHLVRIICSTYPLRIGAHIRPKFRTSQTARDDLHHKPPTGGVKKQSRMGPKGLNGERQRLNREKVSTLAPQEFQAPTDATRA